MNPSAETLTVRVERIIPAPMAEVFAAWQDVKTPGTIWNAAEEFSVDFNVGGLFYWTLKGTAHYGRFLQLNQPNLLQHTWVSPNTLGRESKVTVTFREHKEGTLLTLVHSDLPNTDGARGHQRGWDYFTGVFRDQFGSGSRRKFSWEEAHQSEQA